jgi:hypothetical protein
MGKYSPLSDDDPHYTIIGRVACRWAVLEALIDGAIANLALCGEAEMTCVTAQLIGPAKRMDALIALFRHRKGSDDLRKQLKNFQGRISQLGEDRNRVVRDPLFINDETGQVHKLLATARGELKYSLEPVSKEQMANVAVSIQRAGQEFIELKKAINVEAHERLQEQLLRTYATPADQNRPAENPSGLLQSSE